MSTSNRPTDPFPQEPTSQRGVFAADPLNPPVAPPGAIAAEFKDETGRTIMFAWVAPDHAGQRYCDEAWDWLDRHVPEGPVSRHLKLVSDG